MMIPTRNQIEEIVLDMMKQELVIDEFEKIVHLMAPESYSPIITIFNPLKSLEVLFPDIHTCISYWRYDCYSFGDKVWEVQDTEWNKLQIMWRSLESLKKYLIREWLLETPTVSE